MSLQDLEPSMRKLLRTRGVTLKGIDAQSVLRLAIEHWIDTPIDGFRKEAGDGLVAYFEVMNSGRGTVYEFGVNRILRPQPPEDDIFWKWPTGHRLGLSATYALSAGILACRPAAATLDCWSRESVNEFQAFVERTAQFLALATEAPKAGTIRYSECQVPPGEPNHHSKGLSWAIG
jgi:hypothetical protein